MGNSQRTGIDRGKGFGGVWLQHFQLYIIESCEVSPQARGIIPLPPKVSQKNALKMRGRDINC